MSDQLWFSITMRKIVLMLEPLVEPLLLLLDPPLPLPDAPLLLPVPLLLPPPLLPVLLPETPLLLPVVPELLPVPPLPLAVPELPLPPLDPLLLPFPPFEELSPHAALASAQAVTTCQGRMVVTFVLRNAPRVRRGNSPADEALAGCGYGLRRSAVVGTIVPRLSHPTGDSETSP
jgi:hypothetical protein